jgi:hypothetical protein
VEAGRVRNILLSALVAEGFAEDTQIYQIQQRIQRMQTLIAVEREKLQKARAVQQRKRELERNRKDHQRK